MGMLHAIEAIAQQQYTLAKKHNKLESIELWPREDFMSYAKLDEQAQKLERMIIEINKQTQSAEAISQGSE